VSRAGRALIYLGSVAACAAAPGVGAAQVAVSGATVLSVVEHRVDAGFGVERSSGAVAGVALGLGVGDRFDLDLTARGGTLAARTPETFDRDLGEVGAAASVRPLSWLGLRAAAARRAYSTDVGRQRWTVLSLGAEVRLAVAGPAAAGVIRAAWLPVVEVNGLDRPDVAVATAAGVEYRRGPVSGGLWYELERCDFPPQMMVRRREQVSALTLRVAVRAGRRP